MEVILLAKFKIFIEGKSREVIHHWEIKLGNNSKHDNKKDFQDLQTVMNIIENAVNSIDDALINNNKKGD